VKGCITGALSVKDGVISVDQTNVSDALPVFYAVLTGQ